VVEDVMPKLVTYVFCLTGVSDRARRLSFSFFLSMFSFSTSFFSLFGFVTNSRLVIGLLFLFGPVASTPGSFVKSSPPTYDDSLLQKCCDRPELMLLLSALFFWGRERAPGAGSKSMMFIFGNQYVLF
jgi:hypothetical protein